MNKKKTPFIKWKPAISPEEVFSDAIGLSEIQLDGNNVYWLETRPYEGGRYVIVKKDNKGEIKDVTPPGFNVRSRVHEYGGGSYTVSKDSVYFVNFKDQRIYCKLKDSLEVYPLTLSKNKDGSSAKFACLIVAPDGKRLVFVYEKKCRNKENKNCIGILDIDSKRISEPKIIAEGYDFYAEPVFSPMGDKIAWLQWNHPHMPWDSTELMLGSFRENSIYNAKRVDGGGGKSICFPRFDRKGRLYYVMDKIVDDVSSADNWWNIYRYSGKVEQITAQSAEFGAPHWVFRESNYDFLPDNKMIAKRVRQGRDSLVVIDPGKKSIVSVESGLTSFNSIKANEDGEVLFIGANSYKPQALYSLDVCSKKLRVLKKSSTIKVRDKDISLPVSVKYPTRDNKEAHFFFYLPKNGGFSPPRDEKPPLLVIAHGGPTSRAEDYFSFIIQFWTSAGFAVADVNYRGSTGYGRKYRDALLSKWGIIDAEDVADAVRYLIKENKVDLERVAVRGGSAGGYMVQRVMTQFPEFFKAGASYYGIGNLITLVKQPHKFESRYIDNLIGVKLPEGKSEYKARSPINHLDDLRAPMIIFQGSDDKIVAPQCSREMAEVLRKKGINCEYIEYKGEQHGFRSKKSKVDSLKREYRFYREIFGKGIEKKKEPKV